MKPISTHTLARLRYRLADHKQPVVTMPTKQAIAIVDAALRGGK